MIKTENKYQKLPVYIMRTALQQVSENVNISAAAQAAIED